MPFDYKYICVVGATSGIGKALAAALVGIPSQPTVIAVGRRDERLKDLEAKSGGKIKGLVADVGGTKKAEEFVTKLIKEYPQVDAIIINAGIQRAQNWFEPASVDLQALDQEWEQNYVAVLHLSKHILTHFKKQNKGALVTVTSGLAAVPKADTANYCASKAAVRSLSLSLREAWHDTPISIREISPPLVESELHDHQGMTSALSRYWVPLNEYIPNTIKQLVEVCRPNAICARCDLIFMSTD
ncbi:NAD(P)-binding protein [Auricularia subglabra TFB-10046 SS5]|nr:NAD(P)-binding protein [Auricularia subglabra TFB-10046 SS5]